MAKASASRETLCGFDPYILFDLIVRVILGIFFAFSAGIYYRNALQQVHSLRTMQHIDLAVFTQGLSIFAGALFTMMIACLYVLRYRPVNKFIGWWPSIAAILGGFLMFGLVWFPPRTDLPDDVRLLACGFIFFGNILGAYILTHLGRSFSILPESRKLVTEGPYKYIRHPLYVAEIISTLGQMVLFFSPGAVSLVAIQFMMQLVRIHYEEKVLTENFPAYKKYAKKTARLIPGVY